MKKTLAMLLLLSLILCLLTGCYAETDHYYSDNYYNVTVTGYEDTLIKPIKSRYQAGTIVEIKVHPVNDASLHVFVNNKEIPLSHFDSDYWSFEFVMPEENITIHLTFNQFYGKDEYVFEDLCSLDFLTNEITKVSIRVTNFSEKYSFMETRYSFKQEDIDNFKAIVEQRLIKANNDEASKAIYGNEYTFYYDSKYQNELTKILNFDDNFFIWNDFSSWQAFRFEDKNYVLPTIENPDLLTYSFKYYGRSSDVKKYDDESFSIKYHDIDSVEFIPYEGDMLDTVPMFYLDSGYGKINLLSPTVFELNGEYYEIVSGMKTWAYNLLD